MLTDVSTTRAEAIIIIALMMASVQVVETSVNTNNSPSQDYTTNPDNHSSHNIDSPGFKPFTIKDTIELDEGPSSSSILSNGLLVPARLAPATYSNISNIDI